MDRVTSPEDANTFNSALDTACVKVEVKGEEGANDLVSCLFHQLLGSNDVRFQEVLFESSDVVAFHLVRQPQQRMLPLPQPQPQPNREKDELLWSRHLDNLRDGTIARGPE